jgi:hypothetical protein
MNPTAKYARQAARQIQHDVDALTGDAILESTGYENIAAEVRLDQIRTDGGTQMRAQLDDETILDYFDVMLAAGSYSPFPPVVCYYDGTTYWLSDGFHRVAAARKAFVFNAKIPVFVHPGDRRDAILAAAAANAAHGLRRTNADKRRAVETLLGDNQWTHWSDQEIARRCAVDPKTVGNLRRELTGTMEIPESTTRTTADGRQMHVAPIGEKLRLAGAYALRQLVLEWLADRGSLVEQQELAMRVAGEETTHPDYAALAAHIDTQTAAGKPFNDGPHRWRKIDLNKALSLAVEELDDQIGETTLTAHRLPSGQWYARSHGRPAKATHLYPTLDQALSAAVAGDMDLGRDWHHKNLEQVLDTDRKESAGAVDSIIANALGDDLNELVLGLRRRVADWPDDAMAAERLTAVEKRIAVLTDTVRLVAPGPGGSPLGAPGEPPRRALTPALPAPLLTGVDAALVARRAKLLRLRELYTQACNGLNEFGDCTGHYLDTLPVKRSLTDMLVVIERNLNPQDERNTEP